MVWTLLDTGNFAWPTDLLRATHAKANKKGEIEDILTDCETAKKLHDGIGNFPFPKKKASTAAIALWESDVDAFFSGGPLKKLLGSLKIVSTRATKLMTAKDTSKDAKKALKTIIDCADEHVASVAVSVINPQKESIALALREADKEFVLKSLKSIYGSYKACAAKKHPEIAEAANALKDWSDDETAQKLVRQSVHGKLFDACRDMTQNLQNMTKAMDYGAEIAGLEERDVITIPKVAKTLVPIANAKTTITDGMDRDQLIKLIRTVKVNADLYDEIAKRVP